MKNNIFKISVFIMVLLIPTTFFQSCTDDFEDINTNPKGITNTDLETDFKLVGEQFKQVLLNVYTFTPEWKFQLQQNLIGDVYSGYMLPPTPFAGNSNNITYNLIDGWNGFPWGIAYNDVMAPILAIEKNAGDGFKDFVGWSKICKVEAMHRVSDIYGPIIYTHYGEVTDAGGIEYDCQDVVYDAFFKDLDSAVDALTPFAASDVKPFAAFDLVYGGDYTQWIKFANSLRLRLAMRISKVDPDRAKIEAEKAISNSFGVLESNDDNFMINGGSLGHPLNTINNSWHDVRMGAPMECYLKGYNDPRISKYFVPVVDGEGYHGIRQGVAIGAKTEYENTTSSLALFDNKAQLMTAAEIYFLRAEGALRGWNMGGTAEEFYNTGIETAFAQYGLDASSYMSDATSKPTNFVDPIGHTENNADAPTDITIAWNDGDNFERKLERIITQKWIALYPDGQEAWSEFRRTGYPKLFTVVVNNSSGKISTEDFIKRINFVTNEYATNPDEVSKAVSCLGGDDNGGTPLWWDVD